MTLDESQKQELDSIIVNLGEDDSDIRRWAIYDLEQFPPEISAQYLIKGVEDPHRAVREAAAELLLSIPPEICLGDLTPLLGSPRIEVRNLIAAVIAKFGDAAVDPLMAALEHENEDVRKFSADILGLAKSDRAVEPLAKAMYDPVENVGVSAAEALGKIQSPLALPHLIKAFDSRNYLQRECAEAIGMLGVPEAALQLLEKLPDIDDLLVQYATIDAVGNAGNMEAVDQLKEHLARINPALYGAVVQALLKIAGREKTNLLLRPSAPISVIVSAAAEGDEELQQLLIEHITSDVTDDVLAQLTAIDHALSSSALVALIQAVSSNEKFGSFLLKMVDHQDDWVTFTAIEHLENVSRSDAGKALKSVLAGERNLPQLAAIKAIRRLDLEEGLDWIEPFLESDDEDLRSLATETLQR